MARLYALLGLVIACAWPLPAAAQLDIDVPEVEVPEVEIPDVEEPLEEVEEAVGDAVDGLEEAGEEILGQAAAIRAVRENRALPLDRLLALAGNAIQGQVIDVQLVTRGGVLVYEVKVLTAGGMVTSLFFEASTGAQLAAGQP
jgi:hypothetical protein